MAPSLVFNSRRSYLSRFFSMSCLLPSGKRIEGKILAHSHKAQNGLAPSYLTMLLNGFVPVRALRTSVISTFAVPLFTLKTIGDRSFSLAGCESWKWLTHFFRAGTIARTDTSLVTVSAYLRCYLLATHFVGLSSDSFSPQTFVMGRLAKYKLYCVFFVVYFSKCLVKVVTILKLVAECNSFAHLLHEKLHETITVRGFGVYRVCSA